MTVSYPLNCIAYEPFSNPNYPANVDLALNSDLSKVSLQGFACIKTYNSQFDGFKVADYAKKFNLKVVLGIWIGRNNFSNAEIDAAIYSCKNNDNVIALYAGNKKSYEDDKESINEAKKRLRAGGCNKPFGMVQAIESYPYYIDKNLVDNFDFLGYNFIPFTANITEYEPLYYFKFLIFLKKQNYGKYFSKFILTETGWPSDGNRFNGNVPSLSSAKNYADAFANYLCSGEIKTEWVSYYTFFDPTYKNKNNASAQSYESHLGIADNLGNVKWDVRNLHCQVTENDTASRSFFLKDVYFPSPPWGFIQMKTKTAEECLNYCNYNFRIFCKAFTWKWGICSLKATTENIVKETYSGAYSGLSCDIKANSDVSGELLAEVNFQSDEGNCCLICAKRRDCFGFSWNTTGRGTCYLKGKGAKLYDKAGSKAFAS